jgi:hypothetical protein
MARDYFAEAKALATKLATEGYGTWSQQLTDKIDEGATGTEIVMGLRWVLAQLLQKEQGLSADLRAEAHGLQRALDRLLK